MKLEAIGASTIILAAIEAALDGELATKAFSIIATTVEPVAETLLAIGASITIPADSDAAALGVPATEAISIRAVAVEAVADAVTLTPRGGWLGLRGGGCICR